MEVGQGIEDHPPQPHEYGNACLFEVARQTFLRFKERFLYDIGGIQASRQPRIEPQLDDLPQPRPMLRERIGQCLVASSAHSIDRFPVVGHENLTRILSRLPTRTNQV